MSRESCNAFTIEYQKRRRQGQVWDNYSSTFKDPQPPNWIRMPAGQVLDFRATDDRGGGGRKARYVPPEQDPMSEVVAIAVGSNKFGISGAMSKDRVGPIFMLLPNDIAKGRERIQVFEEILTLDMSEHQFSELTLCIIAKLRDLRVESDGVTEYLKRNDF